jgi:hypothetical protein
MYSKSNDKFEQVKSLYDYVSRTIPEDATPVVDDCVRALEVLSLLESIYRHALCRPYVPAYRSINTNCGRYRSYVKKSEETLLERLDFKPVGDSLLNYAETDVSKTVVCALTCSALWGLVHGALEKEKEKQKSLQAHAARRNNH